MLGEIFSHSLASSPFTILSSLGVATTAGYGALAIAFLVGLEWLQRHKRYALDFESLPALTRWPAYTAVISLIFMLRYTGDSLDFIYFQF
jgi:hypothetical protein